MGLLDILLTSTFIMPGDDIPLYATPERMEQIRLHRQANDIGNSHVNAWLADPQPSPDLLVTSNGGFVSMSDSQGVETITPSSISYCNGRGTLGGLTNINWAEYAVLIKKHFG
jgi:hypothetical protein